MSCNKRFTLEGCPERKTALDDRELARYGIDMAALSETKFTGHGNLTEQNYTFCSSGGVSHQAGVAFPIRNGLRLESFPEGISNRLMKRLPLNTLNVPRTKKLLILGDFNASETWGCVLGQHGHGKCNSNSNMLLELCIEHDLAITNTFFKTPDNWYNTWYHPQSKQWHLLDYVLVHRDDLKDVCSTRVMRGADCDTDHLLAAELQDYADAGNSKAFFDGLKAVYSPRQCGSNPVLSADGSQLHYTPSDILSRWREHFQGVLNRPSTVDNSAIGRLNKHPTRSDLDIPPTEAELIVALKLMSYDKAPGADGSTGEVFKKEGHALHHKLLVLFQTYWEAGNLPQDFRDATIITLQT
nr:uncharacterized protein LOC113829139 [Penaeus vannamei]